ncbi:MAG: hypothetical protein ACM3X7_06850 [Solirubrobacterales bacterium]
MNIPEKIKIGGHILNVIVTNNCDEIEYNTIGRTCLAKNIITLNENYPQSRQEEALLHEIIHNCLYDLKEDQNEAFIERLGTLLYSVIKDNPDIFKS